MEAFVAPDVLRAAERILDEGVYVDLTLAALAQTMGADVSYLAQNDDDLRRLVAMEGWRRLKNAIEAAPAGETSAEAVIGYSCAYRDFVNEHWGLYGLMSNTPLQPKDSDFALLAFDLLTFFREPFAALGCSDANIMHALRAFRAAVHGYILLEKHRAFSDSEDVERSFTWMIRHLIDGFS